MPVEDTAPTAKADGATPSIAISLLALRELDSPGVMSVSVSGLPAVSFIEPPFKLNAEVDS